MRWSARAAESTEATRQTRERGHLERQLGLRRWADPAILSLAFLAFAAGFGQFGAVSTLGDVAKTFGRVTHGATIADRAGLSGTELGVGLAVLRLASLGALPLAGLADRLGRRRLLLGTCALGLLFTIGAAASPGYWWFVAIFALGRPLLSTTNAVAPVSAAEETSTRDRAKAVALIAGGYGVGSGLTAVVHGLGGGTLGFRVVFALALIPLVLLPLASRWVAEPRRFTVAAAAPEQPLPVLGPVGRPFRTRLVVVATLAFAVSVVTGPANSFLFVYAQNVRHLSGAVTALLVIAAGATGLAGLVVGQRLADRLGRRPTGAIGMVGIACFGILAYSGSPLALGFGYVTGVLAGSIFAPAAGALQNELFPTSVRGSVAGWQVASGIIGAVLGLVAFGAVADVGNRFSLAALVTFMLVVPVALMFWLLPETKNREPEDLWPTLP